MAHAADDGYGALRDHAGQLLVIKGPKILGCTTTTNQQNHVHLHRINIGRRLRHSVQRQQSLRQLSRSSFSLHRCRCHHHVDMWYASLQSTRYIVQGGSTQ